VVCRNIKSKLQGVTIISVFDSLEKANNKIKELAEREGGVLISDCNEKYFRIGVSTIRVSVWDVE
jgi:F420-0:gamma-glutamyl ligase